MGIVIALFFAAMAAGAWNNGAHAASAFVAALGIASAVVCYIKQRG